MLDEITAIKDPLLRAELCRELIAEATKLRDDAIREASQEHSLRTIAKAVGFSKSRIHLIVHNTPEGAS